MNRLEYRRRARHIHREPTLPSFALVMSTDYPALLPVLFPVPRIEPDAQSFTTNSTISFAREDSDEDVFVVGRGWRVFETSCSRASEQYTVDDESDGALAAPTSRFRVCVDLRTGLVTEADGVVVGALGRRQWKDG